MQKSRGHTDVNSGNAMTGKVCFYVSLCFLGGTGSLTHWNNNRYINIRLIIIYLLIILNITDTTVSIMCGLWLVKVLMISIRHVALLVYYKVNKPTTMYVAQY